MSTEDWAVIKEYFRKAGQGRRAGNRESSPKVLEELEITFEVKNNGAHLIVYGNNAELIDLWPGTGLWSARQSKQKGRGVFNLVKYIKEQL